MTTGRSLSQLQPRHQGIAARPANDAENYPGSQRDVVAAVDVGGTRIKAALVDRSLTVHASSITPTPPNLAQELPGTLRRIVDDLIADLATGGGTVTVMAGGVVVPGLVDDRAGVGVLSVNLGWRDLPIAAPLTELLGVPVTLGHDVRAGLLAETSAGSAQGEAHAMFLPLGTGIAGALMVDHRILHADGWAGELGHLHVAPDGPRCGCGSRGCLETISSAAAIGRAYVQHTGRQLDAAQIARLVDQGEQPATTIWQQGIAALAQVIAATAGITGIDLVIIGGGLAECGPTLMTPLQQALESDAAGFHRPLRLARAHFGDRAAAIGAAILAWENR